MLSNIVVRLVPEKFVALNVVEVPAAVIALLKLSWVAYSVCTSEVSVVKELESVVIESALTTPLTFEIAVDRPLRFAAAMVTPPTETLVKTVFTKVELLKSTVEPEVVEESWVAKAEMTALEATSVVEPAAVFAAAVPATIKLAT